MRIAFTYLISGFSCEFDSRPWWNDLDTTSCDKFVFYWLSISRWFSPNTPVCLNQYNWSPAYDWNIGETVKREVDTGAGTFVIGIIIL